MTKFGKEVFEKSDLNGGEQYIYRFDNGYGGSVVRHCYSYGYEDGLYELAVLRWEGEESVIDYSTPITDDVVGWLNDDGVAQILIQIESLSKSKTEVVTKYRVFGHTMVTVSIEVEAVNEFEAYMKALETRSFLESYGGNGGDDKLIGVDSSKESVHADNVIIYDDIEKM